MTSKTLASTYVYSMDKDEVIFLAPKLAMTREELTKILADILTYRQRRTQENKR
jgi:hypothetical protein